MYTWKCDTCQTQVDLLRSFDDSAVAPTTTELPTEECEHKWTKVIHPPKMVKSASWGPGKGYWILALLIGASVVYNLCSYVL